MEKVTIVTVTLILFAAFMVLLPKTECMIRPQPLRPQPQLAPRPLCASQFSLANYACALLPLNPLTPSPPSLSISAVAVAVAADDDDDDEDDDDHDHDHDHDNEEHHHTHRRRRSHGGHRRKHKPHHHSQTVDNCCRWASQVDSQCVCELLFLLPGFANFLMRPLHDYTLRISDSCNVTYTCGGTRIRA
ncbi:hypothetical protein I3760_Q018900 [Carya illinoinensis]|nr:hypothetical protein I3760_Q018900 [Carya illinoinensis]